MVIGEYNEAWRAQVEAAAHRYADSALRRQEVEQERKRTGSAVVDSAEQIIARSDRLLTTGEVSAQAFIEVGGANALTSLETRERIINASNQLQAVSFLPRGMRAAARVARISLVDNGREIPQGTGSLVSPRLLLTNNHVLPEPDTAHDAVIEFGAEVDVDNAPGTPARFQLDPDAFFVTDEHLDFTLVAVASGRDGRTAAEAAGGWNSLIAQQGKIVIGESMNIIGHPMGRLKEISIRENRLDLQLEEFLHYITDTEPGNSGSPVFNDQWEVVALHHSGVPKTDSQGRILRGDGNVWHSTDGDDAVDWIANEGVRVSAILRHLSALDLTEPRRAMLAELGPAAAIVGTEALPMVPQPRGASAEAVHHAVRAPFARGVRARESAFGGGRHLLFLHGRGQQGRDPEQLRREWTAGLNRGLTMAGADAVDAADIYFPFYGDALVPPPRTRESLAMDAAEDTYEELVAEAAARLGMPAESVVAEAESREGLAGFGSGLLGRVHDQLSWIAARSGLDDLLIAQHFKDVASYLSNDAVRGGVLDAVMEAVPGSGQLVLVSHSLGTVVAVDLLSRLADDVNVELFVTAGSPLGMDAVYTKLQAGGPHRPDRIGHWLNVWYAGDPVAIGCPLRDRWTGQLEELTVNNPKDRAHDIAEYLAHPAVADNVRRPLGTL